MRRHRTIIINKSNDKMKFISIGLTCLLGLSESLSLNKTTKANGVIDMLKQVKDEISKP